MSRCTLLRGCDPERFSCSAALACAGKAKLRPGRGLSSAGSRQGLIHFSSFPFSPIVLSQLQGQLALLQSISLTQTQGLSRGLERPQDSSKVPKARISPYPKTTDTNPTKRVYCSSPGGFAFPATPATEARPRAHHRLQNALIL